MHLAKVHIAHPGGRLQCTSYLVVGPEGALLVDCGSGYCEGELLAGIRRAGSAPQDVSHVLLTHCHVDHALGAGRVRRRGMRLVAAPRTAEILRAGGHQVWYEFPEAVEPTEVDAAPEDGEVLHVAGLDVRVVHTPGHTDGCATYLVETDAGLAAFTGDLLGGNGHPGWTGSEGFSVEQSLRSIERLLALAPALAFWGHGAIDAPACEWLRRGLQIGRAGQWQLHGELHPDVPPPDGT